MRAFPDSCENGKSGRKKMTSKSPVCTCLLERRRSRKTISHAIFFVRACVGMGLMAKNPDGSEQPLRVAEVNDDHIVIDANHPLAGHDLTFDLELVEIM